MRADLAQQRVQISLAAFPGLRHEEAAQTAIQSAQQGQLTEPLFGEIHCDHVQLVPQNYGTLDEDLCDDLIRAFPDSKFRLHANVRVLSKHVIADISSLELHHSWFEQAARISKRLGATAYSAHSGHRGEASLDEMLDNARRIADMFGCPVGVEGQYPITGDGLLVSTWSEYRTVFESGVPYAIDLSHLNILANKSGTQEWGLVTEMLSCERCIEVHVSENDGMGDWHQVCESKPWWYSLMPYINTSAVTFTEGNHRRKRMVQKNANAKQ